MSQKTRSKKWDFFKQFEVHIPTTSLLIQPTVAFLTFKSSKAVFKIYIKHSNRQVLYLKVEKKKKERKKRNIYVPFN